MRVVKKVAPTAARRDSLTAVHLAEHWVEKTAAKKAVGMAS